MAEPKPCLYCGARYGHATLCGYYPRERPVAPLWLAVLCYFLVCLAGVGVALLCAGCSMPMPQTPPGMLRALGSRVEPIEFKLHPGIVAWLNDGGTIAGGGKPLSFRQAGYRGDRLEFKASHQAGNGVLWCGVSIVSDSPVLDVWFQLSYGGPHITAPLCARQELTAGFWSRGKLDEAIAVDVGGGQVLNGQSAPPVYCRYDAVGRTILREEAPAFAPTSRVPHDGNQTGGHWPYMGLDTVSERMSIVEARALFYPVAGYGGVFYHGDGRLVSEADWPKAVLDGGNAMHWHREAPAWIRYTDPGSPWKDRATMRGADLQHWSIHDGPCLALALHPWDMGLRRLVRAGAQRFLFVAPGTDKGTYQWDPGQAREQGRILKYAVHASAVLEGELAKRVEQRAATRLGHQLAEVRQRIAAARSPWPYFEGSGKHSPAELGIWFWGLYLVADRLGEATPPGVRMLQALLSQYVFDCYYVDSTGNVQLPYFVREDWTHERKKSGTRHFGWLAAHHARPTDRRKAELLEAYGRNLEARWTR